MKTKSARKVVGNTAWRFLQLGVAGSVELATFFVLARWIGPERYGLFTLSLSILALFLLFANFGFGSSITRYIAHYLVTGRDRVGGVVRSGLVLGTGAGLLVGVACIIVAPYVARWYSMSELGVLLRVGALFIFLEAGRGVIEAIFRGFQNFRTAAVVSLVSRPLQMILVLEAVRSGFGVVGAIVGVVLGRLLAYVLLLGGLTSVRNLRAMGPQGRPLLAQTFKEVASYAVPVALYSFVFYLYTDVDLLILGYFTSPEEVGHYHFAKLFFRVPVLVVSTCGLVVSPVVTGCLARGDRKRLQSAFEASETMTLTFVVPIAVLLFVAARPFIDGFFPEYAVCVPLVRIMSVFLLLIALNIICVAGFLVPTGNAPALAKVTAVGAVLNIGADVLLIPLYGALGAVLAMVIAQGIISIWIVRTTLTRLGLQFRIDFAYVRLLPRLLRE